jgi:hypothetical protein
MICYGRKSMYLRSGHNFSKGTNKYEDMNGFKSQALCSIGFTSVSRRLGYTYDMCGGYHSCQMACKVM